MATKITEECINCGVCAPACPNEAISLGAVRYQIEPSRCSECVGFHDQEQCAAVCPVGCCIPDTEHEESEEVLFERARKLHPERAGALELSEATSRFRCQR